MPVDAMATRAQEHVCSSKEEKPDDPSPWSLSGSDLEFRDEELLQPIVHVREFRMDRAAGDSGGEDDALITDQDDDDVADDDVSKPLVTCPDQKSRAEQCLHDESDHDTDMGKPFDKFSSGGAPWRYSHVNDCDRADGESKPKEGSVNEIGNHTSFTGAPWRLSCLRRKASDPEMGHGEGIAKSGAPSFLADARVIRYLALGIASIGVALFATIHSVTEQARLPFVAHHGALRLSMLPVRDFLIGATAAMIGAAAAHPLDLIKVRMQVQDSCSNKQNLCEVTNSIWATSGIRGFFVGVSAALLRQFVYKGTSFAIYETLRASQLSRIFAAIIAGLFGAIVGCPAEVVLVRAQAQGCSAADGSVFGVLFSMVQKDGVKSLFVGIVPLCFRAVVVSVGQLASYDYIKDLLSLLLWNSGMVLSVVAAISAGFISAVMSNPIDVVKTRLQVHCPKGASYNGPLHCVMRIVRDEGCMALLKGVVPTSMRMVPYVSIMMLTNSALQDIM